MLPFFKVGLFQLVHQRTLRRSLNREWGFGIAGRAISRSVAMSRRFPTAGRARLCGLFAASCCLPGLVTRNEIRVVRLYQRVQQRALGNMANTGRRGRQRGRCGAGNARRCASFQCGEVLHETLLYSDGCTVFRAASSPPIGVCPVHLPYQASSRSMRPNRCVYATSLWARDRPAR